jgi:hypothetical protein
MSKFEQIIDDDMYIGLCKFDSEQKKIINNNPHCAEFFCLLNNILNCTDCLSYLKNKNILFNINKNKNKNKIKIKNIENKKSQTEEYCSSHCSNGLIYDFIAEKWDTLDNITISNQSSNVDTYKVIKNFYQSKLIYKFDQIPKFEFEPTMPKPKTVVHWGQLKMLLITIIFLIRQINPDDPEVHIIYPGSARGDNILILCDMFPNTRWYLIDPLHFHPKLKSHKQIIEIKNEYFTNEIAQYYYKKFKNRTYQLLFISDIRVSTDDKSIIENQQSNADWHQIIKPNYSYFKFRCPYEGEIIYPYYDGQIFIQPYAPVGSTESRILLETNLVKKDYNRNEYVGKFVYFNRILRPGYYTKKIIPKDRYFDNCYDCTYFSYLIKNYLNKFIKVNPYKTQSVIEIMKMITRQISKLTIDRIGYQNALIRRNMLDSNKPPNNTPTNNTPTNNKSNNNKSNNKPNNKPNKKTNKKTNNSN